MRRLVLIVMMCLLPLQWSWAAAASVCEHESSGAHFGHHEHKHADAQKKVCTGADEAQQDRGSSNHPDCQGCHGIGVAFLLDTSDRFAVWGSASPPPEYGRVMPEPPVESLLRPPLNLVA